MRCLESFWYWCVLWFRYLADGVYAVLRGHHVLQYTLCQVTGTYNYGVMGVLSSINILICQPTKRFGNYHIFIVFIHLLDYHIYFFQKSDYLHIPFQEINKYWFRYRTSDPMFGIVYERRRRRRISRLNKIALGVSLSSYILIAAIYWTVLLNLTL